MEISERFRYAKPLRADDDTFIITYVLDGEVYVSVGDRDLVITLYDEVTSPDRDAPVAFKVNPVTGDLKRVKTVVKIEFEDE